MKNKIILSTLLLAFTILAQGQGSAPLNDAWKQFKSDLVRKNKVVNQLIPLIKESESADWRMLEEVRIIQDYFNLRLRQDNLDLHEVNTIEDLNSQLDQRISKLFETVRKDKKVLALAAFPDLQAQLEGVMNRLYISAQQYNNVAERIGRKELLLELDGGTTSPKVEF